MDKELYHQLIKEKSETNLKFVGKAIEKQLADEFDHIIKESKDTVVPEGLSDKLSLILKKEEQEWADRERKKKLIKIGRICACFLGVLLLGMTLIWNVEAFREKVYEIFYNETPDYIDFQPIEIPYDKDGIIPEDWIGFWYPYKLPDGFVLFDFFKNGQAIDLIFKNENEEVITFSQYPSEQMSLLVDNENQTLEKVQISFGAAFWRPGKSNNLLMWNKGETFFLLGSGLSKEEMVAIAESIVYLKK
ncbi:MAG: DUF4367 domain-containing protein [Thermacetogeniaceae bacterium]|jgi:hypothetical protein